MIEKLPVFCIKNSAIECLNDFKLIGLYVFIAYTSNKGVSLDIRQTADHFNMDIEKLKKMLLKLADKDLITYTD